MKKIIFAVFAVVTLFSCGKSGGYEINGTVEDDALNGKTIWLKRGENAQFITVDSAIIKDKKFNFSGKVNGNPAYYLTLGISRPVAVFMDNAAIKVELGLNNNNTISGTKLNDDVSRLLKQRYETVEKLRVVGEKYKNSQSDTSFTVEQRKEMEDQVQKLSNSIQDSMLNFVKANIDNAGGEYFLPTVTKNMEPSSIDSLFALAKPETKEKEVFKLIAKNNENAKRVEIGQKFIDFEMPNSDGKMVKLSDYAGKDKYVLIDFWASWCNPCCKEMPNIVSIYSNFKGKNFEIVGVSLDKPDGKDKWQAKIKELKMTWPQLSDLKYWDSDVVSLYSIKSIPHTILLDKNGIIIAKNLRGDELKNKIAELLKN